MKTAALLYVRNDGYKEDERVLVCLKSMLDTFDEVFLLDWNSPEGKNPLLWDIEDKFPKTGKLKHMVIPSNVAKMLTNYDSKAQVCTHVISSNLMLRRCDADWIVVTTIDMIAPNKDKFHEFLSKADKIVVLGLSTAKTAFLQHYSNYSNVSYLIHPSGRNKNSMPEQWNTIWSNTYLKNNYLTNNN